MRRAALLPICLVACGGPAAPLDAPPPPMTTPPPPVTTPPPTPTPPAPPARNELTSLQARLQGAGFLHPTQTASAAAEATFGDGTRRDFTGAANWFSSSATVARIRTGGHIVAVAPGTTTIWAARGDVESNRIRLEVRERGELRGVWVSRWAYSNRADIERIVDDVARANLNAIFLQVRGRANAYYRSRHEPWARRLSGTLGRDPGWDPLGSAIELAHARGIEIHAWLNTFPAWSGSTAPTAPEAGDIEHPLRAHPEWLCADEQGNPMPLGGGGYQFFSPGHPEVRAHIARVAEDIATQYDVDGVHFDYVRYPGRQYCHDSTSEADFATEVAKRPELTWPDFQRERITMMLSDIKGRLARVRPRAALSVANWGIYTNPFGWSSVSRGYDDYFQDAHRWAREGIVDALCPMTYWRLTEPRGLRTDFATLADHHVGAANAGGRHAYMGILAEHDADEIVAQIEAARAAGARGFVLFEINALREGDRLARLADGPLSEPIAAPRYPWK